MFSKKFTFLLALCLCIPFLLRLISFKLEPYPALLFPSGDKQVQVPLTRPIANYSYKQLYGFIPDKGWVQIDEESFLEPIPRNYLSFILDKNKVLFETATDESIMPEGSPKNPVMRFLMRNQNQKNTDEITKEVQDFFQEKLLAQGLDPKFLKIVEFEVTSFPKSSQFSLDTLSQESIRFYE